MNESDVLKIAQEAIRTILIVSAPMLGFSLIVGLVVSIFQAVTQIQEATLAFVPKIIAVLLSIIIFGPWILKVVTEFTTKLLTNVNLYIK
ncbi:flagellar biosynthesis protein FliQ [Anaerosalibacter bizertensis]|uniref:Flagellar biosynthetic protein FliQ n=1 Tax=Anaerosalibacter bizertensis TaxID=932217 RepID=A0A844FG99_9FIRM|nr:flagellar biosynthesis protein FliQ [Anaerosalibacter bizertensis]MBV1818031.1 flagellar biosynthesis protein FliQ [Bacteroidales bacterium MSK.15.36]HHV27249.1 flagellar biosynthesis protein FliQ [Tissierellia bacterium]MBU5293283.1 flagellar biosynthesis protein FliQ [Anaerosalibacter bizertensis]MCB5558807.1 flagellar biosynthesis protein FliQ [Anaerosalibacter bizertensis]MCG4564639.1 flagellar biosynthesis protein FliQ [Anaerosalibacter bizertensis]